MPNRDPDMALVIERPTGSITHECTDETLPAILERLLPVVPVDADTTWRVVRR